MGLFCGIGITQGMIFMVLFSEKCMHAVVSGSYQHSSAPSKGGKGCGWEVHDTEKRAVLIDSSLDTNDATESGGSSPNHVMQCKTLCFLHTSSGGQDPQQE